MQVEKYKNLLYILSMVSSTGWIDLSNNKKANTSRSQFVSAILTMNIFAFFTPPRKLRRLFAVAAPVDLQSSRRNPCTCHRKLLTCSRHRKRPNGNSNFYPMLKKVSGRLKDNSPFPLLFGHLLLYVFFTRFFEIEELIH